MAPKLRNYYCVANKMCALFPCTIPSDTYNFFPPLNSVLGMIIGKCFKCFFFNLHEQYSCYFSLLWLFWKAWHQLTKLYEISLDLALVWFFSGVDPPTMDVLSEDGMFCGIDIGLKKREVLWAMHQQLPF